MPLEIRHPRSGETPFLFACRLGAHQVAARCLELGAEQDPLGDSGLNALQMAASSGQWACAGIILRVARNTPGHTAYVCSLADPFEGNTPLHLAARKGDRPTVAALLQASRRELLARNHAGRTPLMLACAGSDMELPLSPAGARKAVRERTRQGLTSASGAGCSPGKVGTTPQARAELSRLANACATRGGVGARFMDVVGALLLPFDDSSSTGCALDADGCVAPPEAPSVTALDTLAWADADGLCALHLAARAGSAGLVRLLVAAGTHPAIRSAARTGGGEGEPFGGVTPRELAVRGGHTGVVAELDRLLALPALEGAVRTGTVALMATCSGQPAAASVEPDAAAAVGTASVPSLPPPPPPPPRTLATPARVGAGFGPDAQATAKSAVAARQRLMRGLDGALVASAAATTTTTRKGGRVLAAGGGGRPAGLGSATDCATVTCVTALSSYLALPAPWRLLRAPGLTSLFFWDATTGATSWEAPPAVVAHLVAVAAGTAIPPPPPPGCGPAAVPVDALLQPGAPSAPAVPPAHAAPRHALHVSHEAMVTTGASLLPPDRLSEMLLGSLRGDKSSGLATAQDGAPSSSVAPTASSSVGGGAGGGGSSVGGGSGGGGSSGGADQPSDRALIMAALRNKVGVACTTARGGGPLAAAGGSSADEEGAGAGGAALRAALSQSGRLASSLAPAAAAGAAPPTAPGSGVDTPAVPAAVPACSSGGGGGGGGGDPLSSNPAFAPYLRQLRFGTPLMAVLHKAALEGKLSPRELTELEAGVQAHLTRGRPASELGVVAAPAPAAQAPDAAAAAPVAPAPAAPAPAAPAPSVSDSPLHREELLRFVKTLRMGVPPPAVMLKMRAEGVPAGVVLAFEDAVARHSEAGLPMSSLGTVAPPARPAAAAAAAAADPVSAPLPAAAPTTADAANPAARASVESAERFQKYVGMRKRGVPLGAVKCALIQAGIARDDVALFLSAYAAPSALAAQGLLTPDKKQQQQHKADASKPETDAAPPGAAPPGAAPPAPAGPPVGEGGLAGQKAAPEASPAAAALPQASPTAAAARAPRTHAPTLKFHWDPLKLSGSQLDASVWGWLRSSAAPGTALSDDDVALLVNLFGTAVAAPAPGGASAGGSGGAPSAAGAPPKREELRTLLDFKRANNLNISLAQFRRFATSAASTPEERFARVYAALYRLDSEALPKELVEKLALLVPQPDELALLRDFAGDPATLMECDRFFRSLLGLPRFAAKVATLQAVQGTLATAGAVCANARALADACNAVTGSKRLTVLLQLVLEVGNTLNAGTARLEAAAISLDSLLKLAALKGVDKKTSLVDLVATLAHRRDAAAAAAGAGGAAAPAPLCGFADDFNGHLGVAARLEVSELRGELKKLGDALAAAGREAAAEGKDVERDVSEAAAAAAAAAGEDSAPPPAVAAAATAATLVSAVEAPGPATGTATTPCVAPPAGAAVEPAANPAASAAPKLEDPRAALLAGLMKRRAAPAAAAAPPSTDAPPAAAAAAAPVSKHAALAAMLAAKRPPPPAAGASGGPGDGGTGKAPAAPAATGGGASGDAATTNAPAAAAGAEAPPLARKPAARGPRAAAAPAAAPAPRHRNPCGLEDRRHFVAAVAAFATSAGSALADAEAAVAAAEAAAVALARYFGEDPKVTPPSKVFDVLKRFHGQFSAALKAVAARQAKDAKAAAKAAAAGAAAAAGGSAAVAAPAAAPAVVAAAVAAGH